MRVCPGVVQVLQVIATHQVVRDTVAVKIAGQMIDQRGTLSADDNRFKSFACAYGKARATILKPVRAIFIVQPRKMKILPGRTTWAITDLDQILLVGVRSPGESCVTK